MMQHMQQSCTAGFYPVGGGGGRGEASPKKLQASPPVYSCDCTVHVVDLWAYSFPPKQNS